jgi:MEMO1 family protein
MLDNVQPDPLVTLARKAVDEYVRNRRKADEPTSPPPELDGQAGVFVCLKKHGELRGCIGTIEATQPNLGAEIINNAISAAVGDPRFSPVMPDELDDLKYSVDVLGPAEQVNSLDELDAKRYGVIVEAGRKRGLLLPDLEGVNTVEEQVSIAMRKAGIYGDEPVSLYRFQVTRHE